MARINVTRGYTSGVIGAIVSLHAKHYAVGLELGLAFEAKIAMGLSAFLLDMDPLCDLFLLGSVQGTIVGSLLVDGHSPGAGEAQFRWFVVHPLYNPDEVCVLLLSPKRSGSVLIRTTCAAFSLRQPTQMSLWEYTASWS